MKKILFTALSLIVMLFITSCSNEDIEIATVGKKYTLSYNVSTQGMYDQFGLTEDIQENILRKESAVIGVMTFIFNSEGLLVEEDTKTLFTFNPVNQLFELPEGSYTIITIETLLNPDNNNESAKWSINDKENLNTIKIKQKYIEAGKYDVLGVYSDMIQITKNSDLMVTPHAIGSIINFYCYNWGNSEFANLGLCTKDVLDYYLLNPKLPHSNKYIEDKTLSGYTNVRGRISVDLTENKYKKVYVLESDIDYVPSAQKEEDIEKHLWTSSWKGNNITLEDGKSYEFGFYFLYKEGNSNYAISTFADSYSDLLAWKEEIDNELNQSNILFKEPYLTWGGSVSAVKSYMSGYKVGNDGNLLEYEDGTYCLWYYGKNKETEIDYYFTSKTGGLTNAILFFDSEVVGEDDLANAFSELGYIFVMSEGGYTYYVTKDGLNFVEIGLNNSNFWFVNYFSSTNSAKKHISNKNFAPKHTNTQRSVNKLNCDKSSIIDKMRECEKLMQQEYLK